MAARKPIVLILCTGNSCRSQMAEGFLRKHQGHRFDVQSAGTTPKDCVHPLAVRVMTEAGVDVSGQRPKGIETFLGREAVRHLLIVCDQANDTCPRVWPGTFSRDYLPFEDPDHFAGTEDAVLEKFREVRDQVEMAMRHWEPAAAVKA